MTVYSNPHLTAGITPQAVGAIYIDRQVTDLADRLAVPAAALNGDKIQVGVIPGGAVLVPELSTIRLPAIDTGEDGTGKATIGTASSGTAIAAEQAITASLLLRGSSLQPTPVPGDGAAPLGSPTDDIPIYLVLSAALVQQAATGKIVADLAFRAFVAGADAQ